MNAEGRQQNHLPEISEFTAQSTQYASSSSEYAHTSRSAVSYSCSKLPKLTCVNMMKNVYYILSKLCGSARYCVLNIPSTKKAISDYVGNYGIK